MAKMFLCDTRAVCGEYSCLGQRANPKNRVDQFVGLNRQCQKKCWCGVTHTRNVKFMEATDG